MLQNFGLSIPFETEEHIQKYATIPTLRDWGEGVEGGRYTYFAVLLSLIVRKVITTIFEFVESPSVFVFILANAGIDRVARIADRI